MFCILADGGFQCVGNLNVSVLLVAWVQRHIQTGKSPNNLIITPPLRGPQKMVSTGSNNMGSVRAGMLSEVSQAELAERHS